MKQTLLVLMLALHAVTGATYSASAQLINVTYAGKSSGVVSWKEMAADSMLKVTQPGIAVISFQMNHFGPYWDAVGLKSNSNKITPPMRKEFKHLHSDDLLFFINIKAINANGDTLWADPLQFKIK
ncbi:MAG TPA: hypothetical protein VI757_07845 [Bacteroidia bacterium]|nr:hypothetical protein [Bacteroidia bacterium]